MSSGSASQASYSHSSSSSSPSSWPLPFAYQVVSTSTTPMLCTPAATCSGVWPALSRMLGSAPSSSRPSIARAWPLYEK